MKFPSINRTIAALALFLAAITFGTLTSSAQTSVSNIDQFSGWQSCTVCAGANGSGPSVKYSMYQNVSSPSKDGRAAQFNISGGSKYGNALWWKQLGGKPSARNFSYDVYFYLKNPSAAQALEFDVNQSVNGKKFIFGTECNIKGSHTWRVWSASTSWQSTGIPCGMPSAYTWHHLIWNFQRTSDNRVKFVSVTLDGKTSYANRVYGPKNSGVSELNVAFQMDSNGSATPYSTWLDKVTLKYW